MPLPAVAGPPREHALSIFNKAVQRVSPESLVSDAINVNDETGALSILGQDYDLGSKGVRLLAFGKASLLMAR
jgi:glycerate-2-kinase